MGVQVPMRCSIVRISNSKFEKYTNQKLTIVEYFNEIVGEISDQYLFWKIDEKTSKGEVDYIPN